MSPIKLYEQLGSRKIYAKTLLGLVFLFGLINFVMIPEIYAIKNLHDQIITQKINLEKSITRERDIVMLISKKNKVEPELAKLDRSFVSSSKEIEFINAIEGLASNKGISLDLSINETEQSTKNSYKEISLNIQAKGSFVKLMEFLASLESMNYYINIDTLEFTGSNRSVQSFDPKNAEGTTASPTDVSLRLNAITYWKK